MPNEDMSYNFSEITFPSSDGKSVVYAEIYTPKNRSAVGIVQISHGMIDHIGRYRELINYLTNIGYVVAGNHHIGHGRTASKPEDLGFFADKGGVDFLIEDLHEMNRYLRREFPTLPLILLGHSMGSFLARLYAVRYPHTVKGLVIHGTAGANPAVGPGRFVAKCVMLFKGKRHRSGLLTALSVGPYVKSFKKDGKNGWLTREGAMVADRESDPYTLFTFTSSAYHDLFTMLGASNKKEWYKSYPKHLSTLVMSGDADPVGSFGKGPRQVYKNLLIAGCDDVTLKMYEGARHELFNESNRLEVFSDLAAWLESTVNKNKFLF